MPRITAELNKRSRKALRPKETPTWWPLFSKVVGVLIIAVMAWNLMTGSGGVPAQPSPVSVSVAPVQTNPMTSSATVPQTVVVPQSTAPVVSPTAAPADGVVDLPTYNGTTQSVRAEAVVTAENFAKGVSGVVIGRTLRALDASGYFIDVQIDPDGAGPGVVTVVQVRVVLAGQSWVATKVN